MRLNRTQLFCYIQLPEYFTEYFHLHNITRTGAAFGNLRLKLSAMPLSFPFTIPLHSWLTFLILFINESFEMLLPVSQVVLPFSTIMLIHADMLWLNVTQHLN